MAQPEIKNTYWEQVKANTGDVPAPRDLGYKTAAEIRAINSNIIQGTDAYPPNSTVYSSDENSAYVLLGGIFVSQDTKKTYSVIVANRAAVPGILASNPGGTNTDAIQEMKITIAEDCDDFEAVFYNGTFNGSSTAIPGTVNMTVQVGVRPQFFGPNIPAQGYFPTGSRTITLEPGARLGAKLGMNFVKGQTVWLIWKITYAAAPASWPAAMVSTTGTDYNLYGIGLADPTATARTVDPGAPTNTAVIMPPVAIIGRIRQNSKVPRIALAADSIGTTGTGDLTGEVINGVLYRGHMHRALADNYAWIDIGNPGLGGNILSNATAYSTRQLRDQLLDYGITHVIYLLGTNDIFQPNIITACEPWILRTALRGIKIVFGTIVPRTLANNVTESSAGTAALRIAANDYFSARYPTLDYRSIVQDANNPVAWNKVVGGATPTNGSDGVHPNQLLHDAMTVYNRANLARVLY